jgi:hypothetical protein
LSHRGEISTSRPRANRDKRQIRDDIPEIRYPEQLALVRELMIGLILQQWRKRQQGNERYDHQTIEAQDGPLSQRTNNRHLTSRH